MNVTEQCYPTNLGRCYKSSCSCKGWKIGFREDNFIVIFEVGTKLATNFILSKNAKLNVNDAVSFSPREYCFASITKIFCQIMFASIIVLYIYFLIKLLILFTPFTSCLTFTIILYIYTCTMLWL